MFAGYKFPHPLEYHIFIKVQTMGKKPPREAFDDSLTDLIGELQDIREKFQVCYASFRTDLPVGLGMTRTPHNLACAHLLPPHLAHSFMCYGIVSPLVHTLLAHHYTSFRSCQVSSLGNASILSLSTASLLLSRSDTSSQHCKSAAHPLSIRAWLQSPGKFG